MNSIRIAFLLLVFPLWVRADDTLMTLGAGGLQPVKATQISMQSEDLEISVHQIRVRFVFRNDSDKDIESLVAFILPGLNGGDLFNTPISIPKENAWNFMDFHVTEHEKEIATKIEARAVDGERDITEHLRSLGLSPMPFPDVVAANIKKLPLANRNQLKKEGLITNDESPSDEPEKYWWATWTMNVRYYWTQRFPARSTVELVQTYRPIVGGTYLPYGSDVREYLNPYCGRIEALRQIAAFLKNHPVKQQGDNYLGEHTVDYVLTTAHNWAGPIGHFRLSVVTDTSEDILVTCMPGLKRVSPTRYELTKDNFRPTGDLKLLILQQWKDQQ